MKLHIPIILGLVIIVLFFICLFMNKKVREGFTSLLPGNKSLIKNKNSNIDGRYYLVDENGKKIDGLFNLSLISKGNKVIFMIEKNTKLSQLGEPCMQNKDCSSELCDVNGIYNAKGSCVISNASEMETGTYNTKIEEDLNKKYVLYRQNNGKIFIYDSVKQSNTKLVDDSVGFHAISKNILYYVKNEKLYKLVIDENDYSNNTNTLIYNDDTVNVPFSVVDENTVYFTTGNKKTANYWDGIKVNKLFYYDASGNQLRLKNIFRLHSIKKNIIFCELDKKIVKLSSNDGINFSKINSELEKNIEHMSVASDYIVFCSSNKKLYKLDFKLMYPLYELIDSGNNINNLKAINENTLYYVKNNYVKKKSLYRWKNNVIKNIDLENIKTTSYEPLNDNFYVFDRNNDIYKINGLDYSKFPANKTKLKNNISQFYVYHNLLPFNYKNAYSANNKKNFYGYTIINGEYKYDNNGKKYININKFSIRVDIKKEGEKIYLLAGENKYMRFKEFGEDVKNFDDIEKVGLQSSVNQITMPQVQLSEQLCPLGYNECYDEATNAMYCGYQESGFSEGEQIRCLPHSRVCALNENQSGGFEMCNPNVTIRRTPSRLNMLPSVLNTDFYGEENNIAVNCRYLFNQLSQNGLNNLSILTQVKNTDGKKEFKSLGTQYFSPGPNGSAMILQDTPLTNLLNTNPDSSSISTSLAIFIGILLILTILHGVDSEFVSKCKNELVRAKSCNADGSLVTQISDTCKTIITDLQEVNAKINEMELTQFKLEPTSSANIGPNNCAFYLKSYKSHALQDPEYYCEGNSNGSTSLSLIKGGHINAISVGGVSNMGQSQHWIFEDFDSFIIDNSNLKIFRTLIRSQNGLYLEPTHADIQTFSRTGNDISFKANLVSRPSNYWIIVATQFNSDAVTVLNNSLEGGLVDMNNDYNCT